MRAFLLNLFLICYISISSAFAASYGDITVEVVAIYDGDTITVNVPGWPPIVGERIGVRCFGIDTPEMTDKRSYIKALAQAAKQHVVARLRGATKVELRGIQRDKYFRILGTIYVDGENLGDELVAKKLAKPYDGGTKAKWYKADYTAYMKTQ